MSTRTYTNIAPPRALSSAMGTTDTSFGVSGATTLYPSSGPFLITIDRGTTSQEVILCTAVNTSTNVFSVATGGRGYDGTTAVTHLAGATVEHTSAAIDYREPNTFINTLTSPGDLIVGASGAPGYARLGVGASGTFLGSNGTNAAWSTPPVNTGATGPRGATGPSGPSGVSPTSVATPYIWVNPNVSQTLGTLTTIRMDSSSLGGDTGQAPTLSGNTITLNRNGIYAFNSTLSLNAASSGTQYSTLQITVGGGVYTGSTATNGTSWGAAASLAVILPISSGNTVTWSAVSSGNPTVSLGSVPKISTYLTISYLGPIYDGG